MAALILLWYPYTASPTQHRDRPNTLSTIPSCSRIEPHGTRTIVPQPSTISITADELFASPLDSSTTTTGTNASSSNRVAFTS
jgi:hypothetical protein